MKTNAAPSEQSPAYHQQTPLDRLLLADRRQVFAVLVSLIAALVLTEWWIDIEYSLGVLYIIPLMLGGVILNRRQIILLALLCAFARGLFTNVATQLEYILRFIMATIAYSGCGLFVIELRRNRQMYIAHLAQLEMQQALRHEAEEQLRVLVESSPAAIMTLADDGRVLAANRASVEMLGIQTRSELVGISIEPFMPVFCDALRWNDGPGSFRTAAQCWGRRKDGSAFFAQTWFSTYSADGRKRLAAIAVDASDEMRDREEQHFEQLSLNQRILAGAVSHEIRNLCAAVNVVFSNLQRRPELSGDEDFAALGTLVSGLGSLASFELKHRGLPPGTFLLKEVFDRFLVIARPTWEDQGGSVTLDISPDLPPAAGDPNVLLQVLLNLSSNSLRAVADTQADGNVIDKQMHITASTDKSLRIRICDTGPGVKDPEALFHAFQPGAQSTGLGLYVARALVRNIGGDLRYEQTVSGACFVIELLAASALTATLHDSPAAD